MSNLRKSPVALLLNPHVGMLILGVNTQRRDNPLIKEDVLTTYFYIRFMVLSELGSMNPFLFLTLFLLLVLVFQKNSKDIVYINIKVVLSSKTIFIGYILTF